VTELVRKKPQDGAWETEADRSGSGSQAGAARVLGPFPFAFDTPDIENGVEIWTPAVGDVLLDLWIQVTTVFDGDTPLADVGTFVGSPLGFFGASGAGATSLITLDVDGVNGANVGYEAQQTVLTGPSLFSLNVALLWLPDPVARGVPGVFRETNPLLLVVSQSGEKGGDPVGGAAGEGNVYLVVATPSLT
jgi:hypothetical protein